jgi:flagellum-specific ATP synthase
MTYEDIVQMGLYKGGSNPMLDMAISVMPNLKAFLRQGISEGSDFSNTVKFIAGLSDEIARIEGSAKSS